MCIRDRSVTCAYMIPVDEINVSELAAIQFSILNSHCFATAKEYRAQMAVGIHAGVVSGLVHMAAKLCMNRTGMAILMLLSKVGDHLAHNVQEVVLQKLKVKCVDIV